MTSGKSVYPMMQIDWKKELRNVSSVHVSSVQRRECGAGDLHIAAE